MSIVAIMVHVLVQWRFRWVPLPANIPSLEKLAIDPAWTVADWRLAVQIFIDEFSPDETWLPELRAAESNLEQQWAEHIYRHLLESRRAGAQMITINQTEYPPLLSLIADPPFALSVLGKVENLRHAIVAVVGARKASAYAMQHTFDLGQRLAKEGYAVASGGAFGCDIAAHRGVLAAARTLGYAPAIAVFAGGMHELQPSGNQQIFQKLLAEGATCVSERLWWHESKPFDYPIRNRLVAGMASATFMMQAAERSGAMITARLALDQGRDLYVLPHEPDDVRAAGNARLQFEGAPTIDEFFPLCEDETPVP